MSDGKSSESEWRHISPDELDIGGQIGGGGFALVHKAKWDGKRVAVKTLFDPEVTEEQRIEFMDELLVMSRVKHPNIVQLLGACARGSRMCFVMELCSSSVYHLLHMTRTPLTPQQSMSILRDTSAALRYLHDQSPSIVHRDLKSMNLLIDGRGRIKLCDFGLASARARMAGTPQYMAPELLKSSSTFSRAVDVYAFGVLVWEVVTRKVPFDGLDPEDVQERVIGGEHLPIPTYGCSDRLRDLMERCWAMDPSERPGMDEVDDIIKQEFRVAPTVSAAHSGGGDALDMLMGGK